MVLKKHTTCLGVHCSACLKYSTFLDHLSNCCSEEISAFRAFFFVRRSLNSLSSLTVLIVFSCILQLYHQLSNVFVFIPCTAYMNIADLLFQTLSHCLPSSSCTVFEQSTAQCTCNRLMTFTIDRSTLAQERSAHRHSCWKNACMHEVRITCPPPPTKHNHKGWHSAPDAILPGHRRAPQWVPARTPTVHWGPNNGEAVGGPHQPPKGRSGHAMTHAQVSPTHKSSDKHGSGAGYHDRPAGAEDCREIAGEVRADDAGDPASDETSAVHLPQE